MKILITGAHGFMGSNLARFLLEKDYEVKGMVRRGGDFSMLDGIDIELIEGDLEDPQSLREACQGIDTIFHLAGCTHEWDWWPVYKRINVDGTKALLDAAVEASVSRFIYMSSLAVHHFHGIKEGNEETKKDGWLFTGYSRSKIEAEAIVQQYHNDGKIKTIIIRPGVFPYGPNARIHMKIFDTMNSKGWGYVNGGKALVSTVYVDNLSHGMVLALENEKAYGNTYIIADDYKLTWKELSEEFCRALEVPMPKVNAPLFVAYSLGWVLEKFYRLFKIKKAPILTRYTTSLAGKDFYFLPKKAEEELGYKPIVPFEEGVKKTIEWYKNLEKNKK